LWFQALPGKNFDTPSQWEKAAFGSVHLSSQQKQGDCIPQWLMQKVKAYLQNTQSTKKWRCGPTSRTPDLQAGSCEF
jgi:hypothetical protein